ncbi:NADPH-dependent oxidoreductase [Sphingomonas changnyeongensis]|uniref:NADPH-dependent oxidoreductase n=1 Tax=Sphingomonas changnyeongensis TaxID=2698679 RepID=A0A7Z2S4B1_9SPHN|nr:NAD(P)H-dependent oxidoreductase [Sphingomonas changnyeongensis]QHL89880.1 NADPH-dependent oxidoreductase [Sphingomonas changnyeongensis]
MIRTAIIAGSQRPNAQSGKVAAFIAQAAAARGMAAETISLEHQPLPLWTDDPVALPAQDAAWAPLRATIEAADALVLVTPEWNGMVPPALKNFFLYCTGHELADRPAMIVAVSSGNGGSAPAAELRMSSTRDTQICYTPEQVIVRRVTEVLNGAEPASEDDAYIRFRIDYALAVLGEYALALRAVRASGVRRFDILPYGM